MPKPKAAAGAKKSAQEAEPAPQPDAPVAASQQEDAPAKKKRNNNPGVRVQGGRVYDSENGTTCHQCRQKTAEVKAKCRKCTLYFCPKCLENRYQEEVAASNAKPDWACPRCRGDCNCSNCRKKQGMEATGQLAAIAKRAGFGSVSGLLQKNPNAKAIQLPKVPGAASGAAGGGSRAGSGGGASRAAKSGCEGSGGEEAAASAAEARNRAVEKRKAAAAAAEQELLADEELPPGQQEMPEAQPLAVHKSACGAAPGTKRQRGGLAWVADVPAVTAVPEGPAGAELAVVLEFLQVFGAQLQLRSPSLAAFAAELLQPAVGPTAVAAASGRGKARPQAQLLLCPSPDDSLVAAVHCKLLDLVRAYWNVKGATTPASWQGAMRGYWAASLLTQRQAAELRWGHGPPAVAGQIFTRPSQHLEEEGPASGEREEGGAAGEQGQAGAADDEGMGEAVEEEVEVEAALGAGAAAIPAVDYPEGGYWALPVAARVGMLHTLVHDALECGELREFIEGSMGDAEDEEKERRQELAGVRKEAREAIARERDQQIALMIASATTGGLTLEQQQQMLGEARERAEAAAAAAAAARVKSLGEKVHPPTVRAAVVGSDREGRRYLQLQAAPLLTGDGGVIVQSAGCEGVRGAASDCEAVAGAGAATETLCCYPSACLEAVAAALHPRGRREGPLRAALVRAFKLPAAPQPGATAVAAPTSGGGGGGDGNADEEEDEGQQGQSRGRGPAAGEPQAPSGGSKATAGPSGKEGAGGRRAGGRGKSGSPCGDQAAAAASSVEPPAGGGGKRRRDSGDGSAAAATQLAPAKRQRAKAQPPAAPAAPSAAAGAAGAAGGRKGGLRGSSRGGGSPDAAAAKAAAAAPKVGRKAAGRRLPLKVDDLLVA